MIERATCEKNPKAWWAKNLKYKKNDHENQDYKIKKASFFIKIPLERRIMRLKEVTNKKLILKYPMFKELREVENK